VRAGSLNRRVTIQRHVTGTDELGGPIDTWEDVATVWANIRHLSGAESIRSDADVSIVKASIRIRYRTDVTAAMRVVYGTTIYDIQAVLLDAVGREYCDLVCVEGGSNG
jgi:SPP1 family predicted phage head-tail adaptor